MLYLVKLKPEKFRINTRRRHSGSHAYGVGYYPHILVLGYSQDLNFRRGIVWLTPSFTTKVLRAKGQLT